jgi:polyisoprenoid-binding protein YceI
MPGRDGEAVSERRDQIGILAPADAAALLADGTVAGRWVLDPAGSRAEFHVKHFWGAVTVHGSFSQITGEGSAGPDRTVTGRVCIEASSLGTGNKKRDEHLRSADFFDAGRHPQVVVTVTAGHAEPVEFTAHVADTSAETVVLRADLVVDRTRFAMTGSPLGMASATARATVVARFVRP